MITKKDYPLPLYFQIVEDIKQKIKNGIYKIGDALPTEAELIKSYNVSRTTIRRALQELHSNEIIFSIQGKGTYVSNLKPRQNLNTITNWAQTIEKLGMKPSTKEVQFEELLPSIDIKNKLKLDDYTKIIKIKRVRYADDKPMCIMTNLLISNMVPGITEMNLYGNVSLYEILEKKYNFKLKSAVETIEARNASKYESKVFKINQYVSVLDVKRLTYDIFEKPVEIVETISPGDRYSYTMILRGRY